MEHEVSLLPHNGPTQVPILSQLNPAHVLPSYFLRTHFNIIPRLRQSSNRSLLLRLPQKKLLCTFPVSQRATYSVHLIILDFIAQIIFGEEFRP